eukprot:scaffold7377_cov389-Prasinococcus_capsulatus_cf.AAC.21
MYRRRRARVSVLSFLSSSSYRCLRRLRTLRKTGASEWGRRNPENLEGSSGGPCSCSNFTDPCRLVRPSAGILGDPWPGPACRGGGRRWRERCSSRQGSGLEVPLWRALLSLRPVVVLSSGMEGRSARQDEASAAPPPLAYSSLLDDHVPSSRAAGRAPPVRGCNVARCGRGGCLILILVGLLGWTSPPSGAPEPGGGGS